MLTWARGFIRLRPGRHLLVVFALTVLLPGVLLAVFGARTLVQEARFAQQQIRERVERAAELAAHDLERQLREWQSALDGVARSGLSNADALPEAIRESLSEPGGGALVFFARDEGAVWPVHAVLYHAAPQAVASLDLSDDVAFAEASALEIRRKDFAGAIGAYKRLLVRAPSSDRRALLLQRLAQTYRKAGLEREALAAFRSLESSPERIGALPAALIAKHAICISLDRQRASIELAACALDLYRGLIDGRWRLERSRYLYYTTEARAWLEASSTPQEEFLRLTTVEERKRALTDAAADLFDGRQPAGFLVIGGNNPGLAQTDRTALMIAHSWLIARIWPRVFDATVKAGYDVTLLAPGGAALFSSGEGPESAEQTALAVTRAVEDSPLSWRVRLWPRDPAALSADLVRRQTLYRVMLVLVVAFLAFGTLLTARVVRKELEVARLQSEFVSTVSHEFRSPLTGIRQLGEMLMRGRVPSDARRQEYYERITRESDRLMRLVENVLDFSRMEEGRRQYQFAPLDTSRWLRHVATHSQSHFPDNQISIVTTIPDALPMLVADEEALTCAVQNLIDNAVKYSPGRDAVWLDADASNSQVTIRVRDRGVGISGADRTRIFEKFYRGRADITREVKGAGLGLSLVQHIVGAHGGRVDCDSVPGEGTTFSIHLKTAAEPAPAAQRLTAV